MYECNDRSKPGVHIAVAATDSEMDRGLAVHAATPGLKTPLVICYSSYFSGRLLHVKSYSVILQSAGAGNRRKSIKESNFAAQHADLLKPIYKYYQAMQFSTYSADFQWEANCYSILISLHPNAA